MLTFTVLYKGGSATSNLEIALKTAALWMAESFV